MVFHLIFRFSRVSMESSPKLFDLFHRALTNKSLVAELNEMRNSFERKVIPINFITEFHCNTEGDTALQVAVNGKRHEVAEFLVNQLKCHITADLYLQWKRSQVRKCPFSWDKIDYQNVLPTFVLPSPKIAIISNICNQIPVIKLIEYLVDVVNDEIIWMEFVMNSFIASSITSQEKIIALELMGATFIFEKILDPTRGYEPKKAELWRGLECWKQSMSLRNSTAGGGSVIPKIPSHLTDIARRTFGKSVEITTQEELEQLEERSSRPKSLKDWKMICGSLQIQALLVIQRNFYQSNTKSSDSPNSFYLEYLLYYVYYCISQKQYSHAINICLHMLELSDGFNSNLSPKSIAIFTEMFKLVLKCLERKSKDTKNDLLQKELSFVSLLLPIKSGLGIFSNMLPVPPVTFPIPQLFDIMEDIFFFISNWIPWLSEHEIQQLTEDLSRYIHLYNLNHGITSLIHVAVEMVDARCDSLFHSRLAVPIAHLFFKVGANTNEEENGTTHFRSIFGDNCYVPKKNCESFLIVFQILLEAGGHVEKATSGNVTLMKKRIKHPVVGFRLDPFLDPLIDSVLPLACYCTTIIGQLEISFEEILPSRLKSFVRSNGPLIKVRGHSVQSSKRLPTAEK